MRNAAQLATGSLLASVASAQVVQWDIAKIPNPSYKVHRRAGGSVEEIITNERMRGGYFASCTVGTPPQKLTLQLDTGSSDIWVPSVDSSACTDTNSQDGGCTFGAYNYEESKTFNIVNKDFEIRYVDGSHSIGDYISETFGIGDVQLPNTTMGLGLDTDIPYGLVGVGYALNEASVADQIVYPNLPLVMLNEGYIATNAYSLWLNDLDAGTGSILFGGIDTDKYQGSLIRLDVKEDPQTNAFSSFIVELTSLQAHSSSGSDNLPSSSYPIDVVLDSGTTYSYIPQDLAMEVWREVGAQWVGSHQIAAVPCGMASSKGYFTFGFGGQGGPSIKVGMDELVILPPSGRYSANDLCPFGIQNSTSDPYLLGDTFLRSAYVVYDLQNNEIAMAATDFNSTSSNIVPFASKGATIPSSTPASNQNAPPSGTGGSPNYSASGGFTDTSGGGNGGNNGGNGNGDGDSAAMSLGLDASQFLVMGLSMFFMMLGGGMFVLF
ncbi:acid protease [Xylariaceae sp. FL0594]|nr:acid protease [Xylariaceae sp. FL0594]